MQKKVKGCCFKPAAMQAVAKIYIELLNVVSFAIDQVGKGGCESIPTNFVDWPCIPLSV